jgi:hypothetical protein
MTILSRAPFNHLDPKQTPNDADRLAANSYFIPSVCLEKPKRVPKYERRYFDANGDSLGECDVIYVGAFFQFTPRDRSLWNRMVVHGEVPDEYDGLGPTRARKLGIYETETFMKPSIGKVIDVFGPPHRQQTSNNSGNNGGSAA